MQTLILAITRRLEYCLVLWIDTKQAIHLCPRTFLSLGALSHAVNAQHEKKTHPTIYASDFNEHQDVYV